MENGVKTNTMNQIKNKYDFKKWAKNNPALAKCIENNRQFKSIHKGKRCFILGNGPSLKEVNLDLLRGEIIFGVNLCMLSPLLNNVDLTYWLCLDGAFFMNREIYKKQKDTLENFERLKELSAVKCFVPIETRDFIRAKRIDQFLNVNYWGPVRLSMRDVDAKEYCDFDITKFRYMSYSIAIDAVTLAIYMGFSEIYLLGCDASVIKSRVEAFMGETLSEDLHFYSDKKDIDDFVELMNYHGIVHELKTEYNCFSNWEYINKYCWAHQIKLVNLSTKSLLKFIPKGKLEEVLDGTNE